MCAPGLPGARTPIAFIRFGAWMGSSRRVSTLQRAAGWCKAVRGRGELAPERFPEGNGCPRYRALERVIF